MLNLSYQVYHFNGTDLSRVEEQRDVQTEREAENMVRYFNEKVSGDEVYVVLGLPRQLVPELQLLRNTKPGY